MILTAQFHPWLTLLRCRDDSDRTNASLARLFALQRRSIPAHHGQSSAFRNRNGSLPLRLNFIRAADREIIRHRAVTNLILHSANGDAPDFGIHGKHGKSARKAFVEFLSLVPNQKDHLIKVHQIALCAVVSNEIQNLQVGNCVRNPRAAQRAIEIEAKITKL